jgi:putative endonuclease
MSKEYYTYIATNKYNFVFYTGVTDALTRRMYEHKNKLISGFTSKYNINKLVWYEIFKSPEEAIMAEKRIKGWKREKKLELIKEINPKFEDLSKSLDA